MLSIPLQATPSQTLNVVLAGQNCRIDVFRKTTGTFLSLAINDRAILSTVLCRDRVRLVREKYLGFVGDLSFIDMQGQADLVFGRFGSRFVLVYLEAEEA
ncbi:MAG: hypothetical protein VB141_12705 [Burkholderia gladioli]